MGMIQKVDGGYRVTEGNEVQRISDKELIDFIVEEELNFTYVDKADELTEVCPINLLADNYQNIIHLYIERHAV